MNDSFPAETTADSHLVRVVEPLSVALNRSQVLIPEHKQRGRGKAAGRTDRRWATALAHTPKEKKKVFSKGSLGFTSGRLTRGRWRWPRAWGRAGGWRSCRGGTPRFRSCRCSKRGFRAHGELHLFLFCFFFNLTHKNLIEGNVLSSPGVTVDLRPKSHFIQPC